MLLCCETSEFVKVAVGLKKKRPLFIADDFSKFRGRYVAIVGKKIVSSGVNAQKVWLDAKRKHPNAQPELLKVSKSQTLVLTICE